MGFLEDVMEKIAALEDARARLMHDVQYMEWGSGAWERAGDAIAKLTEEIGKLKQWFIK